MRKHGAWAMMRIQIHCLNDFQESIPNDLLRKHGGWDAGTEILLERILELQNNSEPIVATYHCALALVDPTGERVFTTEGIAVGQIAMSFVTKM